MTEVWLIRHGESVSNADLPTGDPAESALTDLGFQQAEQIAEVIVEEPDLIVISPYLRARQTAVPTLIRFPNTPTEEWPVHEFTYLNPARYQGTTGTERRPYAQAYWERHNPYEEENGKGESFTGLMARVQDTVSRLRKHPAEFIIVFSHGLFLRALIWSVMTGTFAATSKTMERYSHLIQALQIPNGAIVKARFSLDDPIFISNFDVRHLK